MTYTASHPQKNRANKYLKLKTKNLLLLLLWILIGTILRFAQLTAKPPWTDEFATLVFSLGNSFQNVPLNQAISLDTLLQPLQPNPSAGIYTVINRLTSEDTHPPLYFVLAHLWMNLFPTDAGLVSLWAARSLPALFGVLSIPATYFISKIAFRSQLVGHLAAAMMAVSAYGIYISQEARHYSLAILWVIASLSCFIVALRQIKAQSLIPLWLVPIWIIINALGISTHYFVGIALLSESIVILAFGWQQFQKYLLNQLKSKSVLFNNFMRISAVAFGTLAGSLIWVSVWNSTNKSQLTAWIKADSFGFIEIINPIAQSFGTWVTMLMLLPVESPQLAVVIASGLVMLLYFIWLVSIFIRSFKLQLKQRNNRLPTLAFSGFFLLVLAIFLAVSYGLKSDITRGARYHYVYFPAVIILIGSCLASCWKSFKEVSIISRYKISGKQSVAIVLIIGILSGITVVSNLGYRKYYRPDLFLPEIEKASQNQVLIATTYKSLTQTGEMMGLAWEFKHKDSQLNPQFLLATKNQEPVVLEKTLDKIPETLDLWLVNFEAPIQLDNRCIADKLEPAPGISGYDYKLYRCHSVNSEVTIP